MSTTKNASVTFSMFLKAVICMYCFVLKVSIESFLSYNKWD